MDKRIKSEREQWFIDRIGKRVYRTNTGCCIHCEKVYKDGLIIGDEEHADYLYIIESEFSAEGNLLRYFDTILERDEFEKQHPEISENNNKKKNNDRFIK